MTRLSARLLAPAVAASAALAIGALVIGAPLAAQQQQPQPPGGFRLPAPSPSPTPRPAGPADERAGVVIPPRVVPTPRIAPLPVLTPEPSPALDSQTAPSAASPRPGPTAAAPGTAQQAGPDTGPPTGAAPTLPVDPGSPQSLPLPQRLPETAPSPLPAAPAPAPAEALVPPLPAWWPWAAGGAGGAVLFGGAALLLLRRRRPKVLRLSDPAASATPATGRAGSEAEAGPPALPRLDLTLDITGATRSLMMFTLQYRLTIANRSDRAVNDLALGVELACARASANDGRGNAPSPGAAQALAAITRIGPHQARSVSGTVQLPLTAIQPLRQGTVPLFVPLVHVTVDGESARAFSRSFVIGPPSPHGAGRLHPIALDQPPGAILGLVAQSVTMPSVSAAA